LVFSNSSCKGQIFFFAFAFVYVFPLSPITLLSELTC
jgi:hypothetical protein